jgi:uncharacterized protein YndB with AHSA1/START domain
MSDVRLLTGMQRPVVRLERHLVDPPAVVWRAITDRDRFRSWFPCDVEVSGDRWEVGATITFRFSPEVIDLTLEGQVLAVDEPKLLAYTWGEDTLRFELHPDADGGTTLVLIDELPPESAARNAAGWEECLERLAGRQSEEPGWQARFDRYAAEFVVVLGPQEGPPSGHRGVQ